MQSDRGAPAYFQPGYRSRSISGSPRPTTSLGGAALQRRHKKRARSALHAPKASAQRSEALLQPDPWSLLTRPKPPNPLLSSRACPPAPGGYPCPYSNFSESSSSSASPSGSSTASSRCNPPSRPSSTSSSC